MDQHVVEHPRRERREAGRDAHRAVGRRARAPAALHPLGPADRGGLREVVAPGEELGPAVEIDGRSRAAALEPPDHLCGRRRLLGRAHPRRHGHPQHVAHHLAGDVLRRLRLRTTSTVSGEGSGRRRPPRCDHSCWGAVSWSAGMSTRRSARPSARPRARRARARRGSAPGRRRCPDGARRPGSRRRGPRPARADRGGRRGRSSRAVEHAAQDGVVELEAGRAAAVEQVARPPLVDLGPGQTRSTRRRRARAGRARAARDRSRAGRR